MGENFDENFLKEIATRLTEWFVRYGRKFSWRKLRDPNMILITELLFQRTRAETIEKVYNEFMSKYGDLDRLASASPDELQRFFSKLGLLYRSERLVDVAREIKEKYGGNVPCDFEKLLQLRGIGVYVASAVLNFGCGKPTPVIDKNVMRVINRLAGITRETEARRFIESLYKFGDHRVISYALIDLGATVCKKTPSCNKCPLNGVCPKHLLKENEWRMLRKVVGKNGEIRLQEQPITSKRSIMKKQG